MTLAPRVQVYTQLSCNAVFGHDVYDHTSNDSTSLLSSPFTNSSVDLYTHTWNTFGPVIDEHGTQPIRILFATPSDEDEDEPDPRSVPSKRCMADAKVQAGAARIQTTMTTVMGTLSALTTGWWGHFGENHGRTRVLAAATLGLFLTDLTFILVSTPHSIFAAHGHKLLIVSPIIEGFLGGWATLQGATMAYISDCTSDGSRSQIFSRFSGVFYLGFSIGPMLGAYLIRHPILAAPSPAGRPVLHNGAPTVTSVFYVAAVCSFVNLLLVLFVFPESLTKRKSKAVGKVVDRIVVVPVPVVQAQGSIAIDPAVKGGLQRFLGPLEPLALLAPKKLPRPEGGYRRDWSLTVLGFGLFMFLLATGIFQIKYLYAEHVYEWGAEQLSYYITLMGAVRAVHLLFVMPHLIGWFKPKPKATPNASVNPTTTNKPSSPAVGKKPKPTLSQLAQEINFDLVLLRCSFFIECISHALVALMPTSAGSGMFVAFTTLSCLGTGVLPAVNSLALCILQIQGDVMSAAGMQQSSGDVGRLFGAFASIQSVGQMILGPLIFGILYGSTVATYPKAIFATAAGITLVALALLCLLRPDVALRLKQQRRVRREEAERGRSRVSKVLDLGSPVLSAQGSSTRST
ncbi:hypothetical protein PHLGIDRAFT_21891 [Phlebiopsis gigantea 11061_1 CR5-6]|uniref:Major facilitator superfamily (MFS) profile domain-containing protein n=1 Tax=Phlebiopsis gigantea (strain 11061_1 CR5-6) TaxID=745531 RepID=A0A0C3NZT5_PHLG1|nr:hypothetical protein PHLGIDRAFT_21891 [Phlebiopsis gigantea 11061_1 CR5-6]